MTRPPLLSVCIPTYNRGNELACRLAAWLAATACDEFEIVVSDNASDDGTEKALAAIADPRLVCCRNPENVGAFENQLRAFASARGTWLMQLTDKDELVPESLGEALSVLRGVGAACGSFRLFNGAVPKMDGSVRSLAGAAAYARYGMGYAHPSGCFFRADIVRREGLLAELRALDEITRPYSTDYLTSLCLRSGAYARIDVPLVRHRLPPYGAGRKSISYVERASYYFTPEFVVREFGEYLRFLCRASGLGPLARLRAVAGLVRRSLFPRMTAFYRRTLEDAAICAWYGVPEDFRRSELVRDLEGDFQAGVRALAAAVGAVDALALRLGAFGCRRDAARQRRQHEAK